MSYVRLGPDSDVYIFKHIYGFYQIHTRDHESYQVNTLVRLTEKLVELEAKGLKIPDRVYARIRREEIDA